MLEQQCTAVVLMTLIVVCNGFQPALVPQRWPASRLRPQCATSPSSSRLRPEIKMVAGISRLSFSLPGSSLPALFPCFGLVRGRRVINLNLHREHLSVDINGAFFLI